MLYKVKSILDECVGHKEDVEAIGEFLRDKSISLTPLSLYEVSSLWECFSNEYCAQFLIVNEDTLNEFWYWIENN